MGTGDEFLKLHGTTARSFSVGSRARAASCAILDLVSETGGLLYPRVTEAQRLAIPSPEDGLVVFDTSYKELYLYTMGTWLALGAGVGSFFPINTTDVLTGFAAYIAGDGKAYETDARYPEKSHFAGIDIGLPDLLQGFGAAEARFSSASTDPAVPGQVVYLARGDDEASDQSRGKLTVVPPTPASMVYPVGVVLSVPANYTAEKKATVVFQPSAYCVAGGSSELASFDATCTISEEVGHLVYVLAAGPDVRKVDIDASPPTKAIGIVTHKPTDTTCVVQTTGRVSAFGLTPGRTCFVGADSKVTSFNPGRHISNVRTIQIVGQAISSTLMELRIDGHITRMRPV